MRKSGKVVVFTPRRTFLRDSWESQPRDWHGRWTKYSPGQARDERGRFAGDGGGFSYDEPQSGILINTELIPGCRIIANRSGNQQDADYVMSVIADASNSVPKGDIAGLKRIDAQAGALWFTATYVESMDEIWLTEAFSSKDRNAQIDSLVHEVGHRVQVREPKLFRKFSNSGLGKQHFHSMVDPAFQAGYRTSKQKSAEVFAESYRMYYRNPDGLASQYPDCYGFWKGARP